MDAQIRRACSNYYNLCELLVQGEPTVSPFDLSKVHSEATFATFGVVGRILELEPQAFEPGTVVLLRYPNRSDPAFT